MNIGEIPTNYRSEHLDHIAVWSTNWKDSAKVLNDFIENIQSPHEKIKIVDYARTNQDIENPFKKDDVMQENYFYFPLKLSRGMNIKVFEKRLK